MRDRIIAHQFMFCDQIKIDGPLWPATWAAYEVESAEMAERLSGFGVILLENKNVRGLMCCR